MLTLKSNLDKIKRYAIEICNDNPDDWKSKETISTLRAFTKKVNAVTREMNKTLNDLYKEHHHRPRASKKNAAPTKKRRIEDSDDETDQVAPSAIVDAPPLAMDSDLVAAPAINDAPPPADQVAAPPPAMESDFAAAPPIVGDKNAALVHEALESNVIPPSPAPLHFPGTPYVAFGLLAAATPCDSWMDDQ